MELKRGITYTIGILTLLIATTYVAIMWGETLNIKIENSKSTFLSYNNDSWIVAGVEYNSLYNGTKSIARGTTTINTSVEGDEITIVRSAHYGNSFVKDTYLFNGKADQKELFPVSHFIEVSNAKGLKFRYVVDNLADTGSKKRINATTFNFGNNMKVELQPGYINGWIGYYKGSDSLGVEYPIDSEYKKLNLRLFDPVINNINMTILEDGIEAARNYEYGTTANVTAITNASLNANNKLCIDIDQPGYGVNYSCQTTNFSINLSLDYLSFKKFAIAGTEYKLVNFSNTSNPAFMNITSYGAVSDGVFFQLTGFNDSMVKYPSNIVIDVGDDGIDDIVYPNMLNGTLAKNDRFTNNLTIENMSFVTAGTNIRYLAYSKNNLEHSVPKNLTLSLWGWESDPNRFSFNEYYRNTSFINSTNFTSIPIIWDDISTPDVNGHFSSSGSYSYTYTQGTSVSHTVSGCSPAGGQTCLTNRPTCSQTSNFYTSSLDFGKYNEVTLQVNQYSANGCYESCGNCEYTVCGYGGITAGISSSGVKTGYDSSVFNGKITIKKEDGYLKWYSGTTFKGQQVYDQSKDYEVYWDLSMDAKRYGSGAGCVAAGGAGVSVTNVTYSGMTTKYEGQLKWNTTIQGQYISTLLYVAPKNISRAKLTTVKRNPSGGTEYLYMSVDNGTTWESATSDNFKVFSVKDNRLRVKINLSVSNPTAPLIIDSYNVEVGTGTVSDIKVDVGNDGKIDYIYNGKLNETYSPLNLNIDSGAVGSYLFTHQDGLYINVPVAFSSGSAGDLQYGNISADQEIGPTEIPLSFFNESKNVSIKIKNTNLTRNYTGILQVSDLDSRWKLDDSANITIHVGATSHSQLINFRNSPFNISFVPDVEYWELFPKSRTESDIQPYGQTTDIPIWNISTTERHTDGVDIYSMLNESVDSCVTDIQFTSDSGEKVHRFESTDYIGSVTLSPLRKEGDYSINTTTGKNSFNQVFTWDAEGHPNVYFNASAYKDVNNGLGNSWLSFWVFFENVSKLKMSSGGYYRPSSFEFGNENSVFQSQWGDTDSVWHYVNCSSEEWCYMTLYFNQSTYNNKADINWSDVRYIEMYAINQSAGAGNQTRILVDDLQIHKSGLSSISVTPTANSLIHRSIKQSNKIWTYTDIECDDYSDSFIIPNFCFFSICSNCVKTFDWNRTCDTYE